MFNFTLRPLLVTVTVAAGLLAAAGPANAGTCVGNPGDAAALVVPAENANVGTATIAGDGVGAIVYDGHAGLGWNGLAVQTGTTSPQTLLEGSRP